MKPIVFATDYSDAAQRVMHYAAELAKAAGADLFLFHVWSMPVMVAEGAIVPVDMDELELAEDKKISTLAATVAAEYGIPVSGTASPGFAVDEMMNYVRRSEAGLVVMAMKKLGPVDRLFGSVATSFMRKSMVPVLIVPDGAAFKKPQIVLLTTDLQTKNDWHELDVLKEIVNYFHCGLHVLNTHNSNEVANADDAKAGLRLEQRLQQIPHVWHLLESDDIISAATKLVDEVEADWVAAVPHKLGFWQGLVHRSVSKDIVVKADKPALILPERHTHLVD